MITCECDKYKVTSNLRAAVWDVEWEYCHGTRFPRRYLDLLHSKRTYGLCPYHDRLLIAQAKDWLYKRLTR